MPTTRTAAALGAALIAGACLAAGATAAPGPAKSSYVGVWVQKSWGLGSTVLPCPVNVPLPPGAPPISCGSQTYLKLFSNGRYETDMPSFARYEAHNGQYAVVPFAGGPAIVFDDDGTQDEPRSYRIALGKPGKKPTKTLAISASMFVTGAGEQVFAMNFVRYTK